jgi:hemerythrin
MIAWNSIYSVHNNEIDQQHRKLVGLLGELESSMKSGRGCDVLDRAIDQMVEYTDYHFLTEERLMAAHAYPKTEAHLAQHCEFKKRALELRRQYDAGQRSLTINTLTFLCEWLLYHILSTDLELGSFLRDKGAESSKL